MKQPKQPSRSAPRFAGIFKQPSKQPSHGLEQPKQPGQSKQPRPSARAKLQRFKDQATKAISEKQKVAQKVAQKTAQLRRKQPKAIKTTMILYIKAKTRATREYIYHCVHRKHREYIPL